MMRFVARQLVDLGVDPRTDPCFARTKHAMWGWAVRPLPVGPAPRLSGWSGCDLWRRGRQAVHGAEPVTASGSSTARVGYLTPGRHSPCGSSRPVTGASSACSTAKTSSLPSRVSCVLPTSPRCRALSSTVPTTSHWSRVRSRRRMMPHGSVRSGPARVDSSPSAPVRRLGAYRPCETTRRRELSSVPSTPTPSTSLRCPPLRQFPPTWRWTSRSRVAQLTVGSSWR